MTEAPVASIDLEGRLNALVDQVELVDVRVVKLSGELYGDSNPQPTEVGFEVNAAVRAVNDLLLCRYDTQAPVKDNEGTLISEIEVGLILAFKMLEDPAKIDRELLNAFMNEYGLFVAMPFCREAVQTMSTRLGLPAITFGFFRRSRPGSLTISVRPGAAESLPS